MAANSAQTAIAKPAEPQKMKQDDPAIPCGLVAKSFFNDTYALRSCNANDVNCQVNSKTESQGSIIDISESGIAWESDVKFKFKNIKEEKLPEGVSSWEEIQWHDMKDEHFIVWMRTAGLPNFRKLWGKIENGLDAGKYQIKIENNYKVDKF